MSITILHFPLLVSNKHRHRHMKYTNTDTA